MTAVIPIFKSTENILTNPKDICKYVLDAYVRTPKGINDTFKEREVSLTHDIAKYVTKDTLIGVVTENLRRTLTNYFIDNQITIDVDVVEGDSETISDISISISVFKNGKNYTVGNQIVIDQFGNIRVGN